MEECVPCKLFVGSPAPKQHTPISNGCNMI